MVLNTDSYVILLAQVSRFALCFLFPFFCVGPIVLVRYAELMSRTKIYATFDYLCITVKFFFLL